ncbi:MAG: VanZ family protein [Pseudomonadales bacterium]
MKTFSVAARVLLLTAVALILWLALTPNPPRAGGLFDLDKVNHIVAFFVLAALMEYAFPYLKAWSIKLLPLVAFGVSIELLQFWIGYRYFEWADMVADGVGLMLFWGFRGKIRAIVDPVIQNTMGH